MVTRLETFSHTQSEIMGNVYVTIKTIVEIRGEVANYQQKLRNLYLRGKITKEVSENARAS